MRRVPLETLASLWIFIAAIALIVEFSGYFEAGLTNGRGYPLGHDFINMWAGAKLTALGRTAEIYDFGAFHAFHLSVVDAGIQLYHYSYPPVMAVLSLPLAAVPYIPALALWLAASTAFFVLAVRCVLPWPRAALFALATPALFLSITAGQNGALTAALLGGGLCLIDRRPILAGILLGLLVVKPQLGLLLPFALAAGRHWRVFFAASATVIVLGAISYGLFGLDGWTAYLDRAGILRTAILEDGTGVWHRMVSVFVAVKQLGAGLETAYAIQAAAAAIALLTVIAVWASHVPLPLKCAVLVVGGLLATPYLQDYDLVIALFVVIWAVQAVGASRLTPAGIAALSALMVLPMLAAPIGKLTGLSVGGFVIAGVYVYLLHLSLRARKVAPVQTAAQAPYSRQ